MGNKIYDVAIVGAGVIGCAIARELSKYKVDVLILEKDNDVSNGSSKANSAIVHGGYDAKNGSMKARFARKGNRMYQQLNDELNFGYLECGSMVLAFEEKDLITLNKLKKNGEKNGVDDLVILNHEEVLKKEPHVNPEVKYALYCKTAGITSPYEMTIALAENAIHNGAILKLKSEVTDLKKMKEGFHITTKSGDYSARYMVNAAGLYSDTIPRMLGMNEFSINPRKGEYILLNKNQGHLASGVLFQTPTPKGKGILVTRTYHGNLMLGPNAQEVQEKDDVGTEQDVLNYIENTARKSVKDFDMKFKIKMFAGMRASSSIHDFIIEESKVKGFINVAGIESPGLTSSPAISIYVTDLLEKAGLNLQVDKTFDPIRKPIIIQKNDDFSGTIDDENPDKNIICRCEKVTESEIVDALSRGIYIDHVDGMKRRTRCTMGLCQGNFCTSRVKKIIAREHGIKEEDVTVRGNIE